MRPADARFTEDVKDEIGWLIQTFPLYSGQNAPDPSMRGQRKDPEETFRVRNNWLDASPEEREQMLKIGLYEIVMTTVTQVLKEVLGGSKQPLPTFKHYEKAGVRFVSTGVKEGIKRWIKETRGYNKPQGHQKERLFDLLDQILDSMDLFEKNTHSLEDCQKDDKDDDDDDDDDDDWDDCVKEDEHNGMGASKDIKKDSIVARLELRHGNSYKSWLRHGNSYNYCLRGSDDFQIPPPPRTYHTRGRRTKQPPPLRAAIKRNGQQRWGQNAQRRSLRY